MGRQKAESTGDGLPLLPLLGGGSMSRTNRVCRLSAQAEVGPAPLPLKAPERPSQCRKYLRDRLTAAFPGIVDDFVKDHKTVGSCQRLKYVTEILDTPVKAKRTLPKSRTLSKWVKEMRQGGFG